MPQIPSCNLAYPRKILMGVLFCLIASGIFCQPVFAWTDAGHKIIASLAYRQLSPAQRSKLVEILRSHPRYAEDFAAQIPVELADAPDEELAEWHLQQAAIWPDIARDLPEQIRPRFNKPFWHWVNHPLFLTSADRQKLEPTLQINLQTAPPSVDAAAATLDQMNIIQALAWSRRTLADNNAPAADRATAITWLFHLTGDSHQPLHSTAIFTPRLFPAGDRGGNLISTGQRTNLHFVWDALKGERLTLREARNKALGMISTPAQQAVGLVAAAQLDHEIWLKESHILAKTAVYDSVVLGHIRAFEANPAAEKLEPLVLPTEYLQTAGQIAELRLIQAGYRLGAVVAECLGE
ncbi:MAG: S1/P1 nuclease [Pirellulales bacterium]|nr:S1/P1 nuclease [Pirellulales bacterium]